MNADDVLTHLDSLDVQVVAAGTSLRFRPASRVPPDLLEVLRSQKAELLSVIQLRGWPSESRDCVRQHRRLEARLYPFVGRPIATPDGVGTLVYAGPDRAAVAFEPDPARLRYFIPSEIGPVGYQPIAPENEQGENR